MEIIQWVAPPLWLALGFAGGIVFAYTNKMKYPVWVCVICTVCGAVTLAVSLCYVFVDNFGGKILFDFSKKEKE